MCISRNYKIEKTRIILWFRNDIRLHDNYIINWAVRYGTRGAPKEIIPLFCFDPRFYNEGRSKTDYNTRKVGLIRSKFQLECVKSFRNDLKVVGSNLIISTRKPEVMISELLDPDEHTHNIIVYQREIFPEEV